ncbi:MAG: hypothetical protein WCK11_04140 [Candidatus Falkowbacteria bacterium]
MQNWNSTKNKKFIYIIAGLVVMLLIMSLVRWRVIEREKGVVVTESLVDLAEIKSASAVTGRTLQPSNYLTPLSPKNAEERRQYPLAIFTLEEVMNQMLADARRWSADAKPLYIHSAGAVGLDGKSSQWQAVFTSRLKNAAFELVYRGDSLWRQSQITKQDEGENLPVTLPSTRLQIMSNSDLPQFSNRSMTSIGWYYNLDAKKWFYQIALDGNQLVSGPL